MKKEDKYKELNPEDINPFEYINKVDELPPSLKKEVMATINYAHLMSDLGKLFSVDMANTATRMIDPSSDTED
ncbi:hypothetical protein [Ekhidna sp.]|uniref:hypothetical protein n=1 Tax=Ekhidna sp. TaxID=2608089 RepID=UPI00329A1D86